MRGSGTAADPYIFDNVNDLQDMSLDLAAFYEMDADMDASATAGWNWNPGRGVFEGFIPVGPGGAPGMFTGSFNGNGHTINGLYMNWAQSIVGLFGYVNGGQVRNVGLINCNISGEGNTGALIGEALGGTQVSHCYSTGEVHVYGPAAAHHRGGGLIGEVTAAGTIVERCFSTAFMVGYGRNDWPSASVAGFAGMVSHDAIVRDCYARGDIRALGLPGWPPPPLARVRGAGFVVQLNDFGPFQASVIDNCYSTGNLDPNLENVGGLISLLLAPGVCTDSFWDTDTSGTLVSAGGTGRTTAQMRTETTFTGVGWDFATIWFMSPHLNSGYPSLRGAPVIPPPPVNPVISLPEVATLSATGVT